MKAFLSLLAILWNSAFRWVYLSISPFSFASLLFSTICKASSDNDFAFLHFFCFGMVLVTTSCAMFGTSFHTSSELYIPDLISLIKNNRMISVRFQGKPFNIMVIQVYAPTTNAEEAEQFFEDQQDLLEPTHTHTHTHTNKNKKHRCPWLECKSRKPKDTWSKKQV